MLAPILALVTLFLVILFGLYSYKWPWSEKERVAMAFTFMLSVITCAFIATRDFNIPPKNEVQKINQE